MNLSHRLRHISTRNEITYYSLNSVVNLQREFFQTGDNLLFNPLTQKQLADTIKLQYSCEADHSCLSRLSRTISVLTPRGKEMPVSSFFVSSRDICKNHLREILKSETRKLQTGELEKPYSDKELKNQLMENFGVSAGRRTIAFCRNELGIASYRKRRQTLTYSLLTTAFSPLYPLSRISIESNVPPPQRRV